MLISTSLLAIAKGAIFLLKSATVKGALIKSGAYLVNHYSVGTLVSSSIEVCATTGVVLAACSTVERSRQGYLELVEAFETQSYSKFCDAVYQLVRAGVGYSSIAGQFNEFVDTLDYDDEVRISLKKTMKQVEWLIYDKTEKKAFDILNEAETLLRKSQYSKSLYTDKLNDIYRENAMKMSDDYTVVLGIAGKIYKEICALNVLSGLRSSKSKAYDHYLVFCIAGWILDHVTLSCLRNKTQRQFARDITDNNLVWIRGQGY